jgi:phosphate transport system ATP-binding protein
MMLAAGSGHKTFNAQLGGEAEVSIEANPGGTGPGRHGQPGVPPQATAGTATRTSQGAAATSTTSLQAVDLTLSFGTRAVLSNISLDIQQGAVTALLGPTGSGKTTLLRTFNRMNDKVTGYRHDGDVILDGRSIWSPAVELMSLRRKVGMLFQRPNPFPMSIMDNVVAGTRAHRLASRAGLRQIAQEKLTEVGLWGAVEKRLKDSPFRLSGGQQQLLCLARALAIEPQVLLLDEPTSSLDPVATESIEALIRTLVPRLTVVIVTHNLAQARRVSDRTVFLNAGRLVEHGDTQQVFENPAEEETARYVGGRFG